MVEVLTPVTFETTPAGTPLPYRPSWLDRLYDAVERLPLPAWAAYAIAWAVLFLAYTAIKWYDGSYPVGQFNLYHLGFTALPFYALAAMHYLDTMASRALDRFRPELADPAMFQQLRYRLTTLPALPVLAIFLFVFVDVLVPNNQWNRDELKFLLLDTSPAAGVLETIISLGGAYIPFLYVYHTIHQLRVVNTIYGQHAHVDLLKLKPLYAFASLAAITAVIPIPALYFETLTVPASLYNERSSSLVILWALFGLLGLVTFILPLWGAHTLLEKAKESAQADLDARTQSLLAQIHTSADNRDFADAAPSTSMKNLLDSLVTERTLLDKISTWPWSAETPRLLASALILPVVLLLIAQILRRIIGP